MGTQGINPPSQPPEGFGRRLAELQRALREYDIRRTERSTAMDGTNGASSAPVASADPMEPPAVAPANAPTSEVQTAPTTAVPRRAMKISVCLADVAQEPVKWLWPGRIPIGKLTILEGDPGLGKSLLTLDIAARVSQGIPFPDGAPCSRGGVVVLSAEDGIADTIKLRLLAARADVSRIHTILAIPTLGGPQFPDIVTHADVIGAEAARFGATLIVIDPLNAYLPTTVNAWSDHAIRRALAPFAAVAQRLGIAVVLVRHLNKRESDNALYRGGGSIGIVAAARAAFLVAAHPDDSNKRVFAAVKMNLAPKPSSLAYRIATAEDVPRVEWDGEVDIDADELLAASQEAAPSELERAVTFLRSALQAGPTPAEDVKRMARGAGIAERTLKRAKRRIAVVAKHEGYGAGSRWLWELPVETI